MSTGFHTLYIRVQDENNTWSLYDKRTFFISELFTSNPINNIVEAAYYFDSEPGIGNGTALAISNSGTEINEAYAFMPASQLKDILKQKVDEVNALLKQCREKYHEVNFFVNKAFAKNDKHRQIKRNTC